MEDNNDINGLCNIKLVYKYDMLYIYSNIKFNAHAL